MQAGRQAENFSEPENHAALKKAKYQILLRLNKFLSNSQSYFQILLRLNKFLSNSLRVVRPPAICNVVMNLYVWLILILSLPFSANSQILRPPSSLLRPPSLHRRPSGRTAAKSQTYEIGSICLAQISLPCSFPARPSSKRRGGSCKGRRREGGESEASTAEGQGLTRALLARAER